MTTRGEFVHVYSLAIIEARDIRETSPAQTLYVRPTLSEKKLEKTEAKQGPTPTWEHTCFLTAGLSSVLSLHLKQSRKLNFPALLGSVDIKVEELLDQCGNNERTTLALRDKRGREAGSLVIGLQDVTAHAPNAVVDEAIRDVDRGLPPRQIQNHIDSVAAARDMGSRVVTALKQVVEKTKVVADCVDKTAMLHPYANIAWKILDSAYQAVRGQIERDVALHDLVDSMGDLYSFVDDVNELKNKIKSLEHVIIQISVQMTECGIFIKQYVSHGFAGRLVREPFSDTSQAISNLSQVLKNLKEDLHLGVAFHTAFISARMSRGVEKLAEAEALKALNPTTMNAGNRDTCLPGTRVAILENLIDSLTDPSGPNIIWFRGPAGSGKSTILNSVAQHFSELRRCGAFLFWDRNDPVNSDPLRVIHTLAFQLARFNPIIGAELAAHIENSPGISTSSLDMQFKHLLEEPLTKLAGNRDMGPIVIVLDALDECGTAGTRRNLLRTLSEGLARLPSMFRLLIASRDEHDIHAALSRLDVGVRGAPIDDESTSSDIKLLFQQRLASHTDTFAKHRLPSDWPTQPIIDKLVTLSGGLFIWASTTIRFIESDFPEERLGKVLAGSAHGPGTGLDKLYRVALTYLFESYTESELKSVNSILGAIVVAREQLTDEQLRQLLGLGIRDVQTILSKLQPLLRGERGYGRPVQVLHTSFTDFLCDLRRCQDLQWYINTSTHHRDLASGCLQIMQRDLKFNICEIKTSYRRNKEIEGLQERVTRAIAPVLMYASQYWGDHLECGSVSEPGLHPLADTVMNFFHHRFLYWIEVFSVTDRMSIIYVILRRLVSWARNYARGLEEIISEAHRFVNAFGYPISQSLPHIYLSALPFSPSQSPILHYVHNAFRNTLSVRGRISDRWPAIRQTIPGHSDSVTSVAFSSDGTRIISGSDDKMVRIWDAVSGAPIGEPLKGHSGSVTSVAFSSDGTRIISGSDDKTVQIWDAMSGAPIGEPLEGHRGPVTSVAFSSDATQIISGSEDKTVQIWDAVARAQIGEALEGHSDSVRSVAFSSNDTHIVSGSSDKTIRIWDSVSRAPIGGPLQGHSDSVRSVAFSPDCTCIISGSSDKTVQIWDAESGEPLGMPLEGHSDCVTSVAFSSDGTRIISGSDDKTVRMWDAMSRVPIGEPLEGHTRSVTSVAYSPNFTRIISASDDRTVRIWDAVSGAPIDEPPQGHSGSVTSVAYSSDSTRIISGSSDKTVRIWEAISGAPIGKPLEGHSHAVTSVAFSSNGTRIISGSLDKTVRIWDAKLGEQIGKPLVGHTHSITSVAYSFDGAHIISGSFDKTVRIWNAESGAQIGKPLEGHTQSVTSVAYSSDGTRIISGSSDKTIRIWDAKSGALVGKPLEGHSRSVASIAFSFDGAYIISGSDDKTVRIWDARGGDLISEPLEGHSGSVRSVAFSSDGTHFISGSSDKTVRIWNAKSGALIGEPLQGHSDWVTSVAFSSNGTCIVSGSFDKRVRIWALMDEMVQSSPLLAGAAHWNGAPWFSGGLLHDDGWATTTNGLLLFWVPPEHHFGLCWPHTRMVIGAQPTQLDMQCFVHGLEWMQCYTGGH